MQGFVQSQRASDGPLGVVRVEGGSAEDTAHRIADDLVNDAAVLSDDVIGDGELGVERTKGF